jgi:hypothetical protein
VYSIPQFLQQHKETQLPQHLLPLVRLSLTPALANIKVMMDLLGMISTLDIILKYH